MLRPLSPDGLKQIPVAGPPRPRQAAPTPENPERARLLQACRDFEAIFLAQLLKCMRATVPGGGFLGQSREQRLFRELLDERTAEQLAESGQTGIAEAMYRQVAGRLGDARVIPNGAEGSDESPPIERDSPPSARNDDTAGLKPSGAAAEDRE